MSQSNNLAPIGSKPSDNGFTADTYFNNLTLPPINVGQNINDAVQSFFERVTGDSTSAEILASAVIYTSASQGIDPMSTIAEFQKLSPGQLNEYLTVFLNLNRHGTSVLGINSQSTAGQFITRSILV